MHPRVLKHRINWGGRAKGKGWRGERVTGGRHAHDGEISGMEYTVPGRQRTCDDKVYGPWGIGKLEDIRVRRKVRCRELP